MEAKKTPEQYEEIWNGHINQISRLAWNLPEKADRDELKGIRERLLEIVKIAKSNHD